LGDVRYSVPVQVAAPELPDRGGVFQALGRWLEFRWGAPHDHHPAAMFVPGGSVTDSTEEPRDRRPDDGVTAAIVPSAGGRGRFRTRTVLLSVGGAVVVVGVVLGVTLMGSHSSPASSSSPAKAGAFTYAAPTDSSSDGSDLMAVGGDPGCAPAESALVTLTDNLVIDVTDPTTAVADVKAATDGVSAASAGSRSPAVRQVLRKASGDLTALNGVAASGDATKISSALGPISTDIADLYSACSR
jgi:hypothetical protein